MEVLGDLIEDKCSEGLWNPIKASQNGPTFSHLFFADDLMLFTKADRKNCVAIKEVLDSFCELSRQKISNEKSRVYFSPNVDQDSQEGLCDILGFKPTTSLGMYLGFPIKHKGTRQDYGFILDHMKSKMAGWKSNLLSLAGRIVLTQSVTSTIPSYVMQHTTLPPKILQGIDKLNRDFLWGTSESRKKVHLIGWNKITKAKEEGGLSIHAAKPKNIALLAKLNWRFHTENLPFGLDFCRINTEVSVEGLEAQLAFPPAHPLGSV